MAARLGLLTAILVSTCLPISVFAQAPVSKVVTLVAPQAAPTPNGSWPVYHRDNAHTGYDPSAPAATTIQPTPAWIETALVGQVYASPLIHNGLVFAATLANNVYALDQATGAIYWSQNLGTSQVIPSSQCGNVSPMGILGTPVIDTAANRIYAVALLAGSPAVYHLFGLDLASGTILLDIQIAPTGFDWTIQQQRGALALANGYVYVPFGGRAGDCGSYHGWVVAVPVASPAPNLEWHTGGTAAGIWAAGGVVVDDVSHNIFVATGNAIPCTAGVYSDAIVRLSPTLTSPIFFEPSDWHSNWCSPDSDLGSASPVLISPTLMFTAGKRGGGFLLDPTNLGGVNGQLYPPGTPTYTQADVCLGQLSDATFGGFAYANGFVYLECETPGGGLGLVGLSVNTAAKTFMPCDASCPTPDWNAGGTTRYGPPIVAGGAVWAANSGGGGGLTAFNPTTGAVVYQSAGFPVHRFVTPAEAGGQVFVPADTVIKSFSFATPPVTLTPSSLSFGGQAPTTTSAAQTVTLRNNQATTLTVTTAAITGANAANYVKGTDTCTAAVLAANGTCTVQVSFRPGTYGGFPASLTFTDSATSSPQTVPLSGMGALDNQTHLYTLDGFGGLHANGSAPAMSAGTYWAGWNIARSAALFPDGTGGYVLDGFGGPHPFGSAGAVSGYSYFGWDIARQVVLAPWATAANPAGWTLDGYGGLHAFGGAPAVSATAYWGGWDIVRGVVILPDSTPSSVAGYTLDGWGGVHPFGGAPAIGNASYWQGWDIARGITLTPSSSKADAAGWTVDAYGGVHPFGSAHAVSASSYWPGWDIARGLVAWTGGGSPGGWVLDGWGGLHPFGGAPAVANGAYWAGWDIATSLGGPNFGSGSRRRT